MTNKPDMLRVRGNTKDRLRQLAKLRGWTMTEAAERAVTAFEQAEGIGAKPHPRKRTAKTSAA